MSNLDKCPFCGETIESDSFYCDQCGDALKVCPKGHGFKKGKICGACGEMLLLAKDFVAQTTAINTQQASSSSIIANHAAYTNASENQNNAIPNTAPKVEASPVTAESTFRPEVALRYLVSSQLNVRMELIDGATIGRRNGQYINIFASQCYVSGTHAKLQKISAMEWTITDLDSTNGTFLNGTQLPPNVATPFKKGDKIAFYDLEFIVE